MTVRALPHLRFKDPETQKAYDAIREALQEGNGERGDPNNRWLTVADLDGAITQRINVVSSGGDTPTTPTDPEDPVTPNPPTPGGDGLDPPAPISLTTTPDAWAIRLTWEQPADMPTDYDVTEIWCRNATSGDKLYAGALRGNQFVFTGLDDHLLRNDETWYFWVRNKDIEDRFSTYYPANDVGVEGKAKESPEDGIGGLIGDITSGTLWEYLGEKIKLLQGPEGIPNSVQARLADQYDDLVQRISDVTVSGNGTIDAAEVWFFDASAQGWAGSSATVTWASGAITAVATANNGELISPVLTTPIDGAKYPAIRVRSQQLAGAEWVKGIKFKTSGGTWYSYTPTVPPLSGPQYTESGYSDTDWDLSEVANWTGNTIVQLAFVLEESGQEIKFDWIAIGRIAPGASYAQVEAVRVLSDKKNRAFFVPNSGAPNYAGPSNPYSDGYALKVYDLWFDTATAVYDGTTGALLRGGNKPYRWSGTAWVETTDTRLADSWAEIYDIRTATANPSGAAAQRINGIAANATSALATGAANTAAIQAEATARANGDAALAQEISQISAGVNYASRVFIQATTPASDSNYTLKTNDLWYDTSVANKVTLKYWTGSAWEVRRADTKVFYVAYASRPTTGLLIGDLLYDTSNNNAPYIWNGTIWVSALEGYINTLADAKITTFEQTKVGYATVASGFTHDNVAYAAGNLFDNNGTIWTKAQVDAWNAANTNPPKTLTWNAKLPLATAIKQVRVSDGADSLTIEQQFTAKKNIDNQLLGQYTVKIDNNGWVSGFGLASQTQSDGTVTSDFGIRADRFWIGAPANPVSSLFRELDDIGAGETRLVIRTVYGRLKSSDPAEWLTYLQTTTAPGVTAGEWFTLKDIRQTATTTTENLKTVYIGSWLAAAVGQGGYYTATTPITLQSLPGVTNSSNTIIFRTGSDLGKGYTTSATVPPYNDKAQLVPNKTIPFIVTNRTLNYNGVNIPAGVYMNAAYISDATITNAKIADAAITSAKIAQSIQSTNYSPGAKTGWIINKDGNVEFNNGVWRGTLQSDPFVQGSTGWQLQVDGDAEFNSVIVRNASKNISNGSMIRMRVWGGQGTDALNVPNNTSDPYTIWSSSYAFLHEPGALITIIATVQFECPTTTTTIHLEASDGTNTATKVLYDRYGTSNPGLGARFFNGTTMFLLYVPSSRVGTVRLKVRHIAGSPANYRDITLHTQEMYA